MADFTVSIQSVLNGNEIGYPEEIDLLQSDNLEEIIKQVCCFCGVKPRVTVYNYRQR